MILMQGKGVSTGVEKGKLYFYQRSDTTAVKRTVVDLEAEKLRLADAQKAAQEQLEVLAESLDIPVWLAALGASNAVHVQGTLPGDRERMLRALREAQRNLKEEELRQYRVSLPHL